MFLKTEKKIFVFKIIRIGVDRALLYTQPHIQWMEHATHGTVAMKERKTHKITLHLSYSEKK